MAWTNQGTLMLSGSVRQELGVCGVANIPNQVHHVASYQRFDFNILLMGEVSCGKTALVNRILAQRVFANEITAQYLAPSASSPSVPIRVRQQAVVEEDVKGTIRLIDAPLVGHSIRKDSGYQALCNYALEQQSAHLGHELHPQRSTRSYVDARIHVCLYFISPHQAQLSKVDLTCLKTIASITNVLLVVCKADLLTSGEAVALETTVLEQCREHQISLFDGRLHRASSRNEVNDTLQGLLMSVDYLPELIDRAQHTHYEAFRRQQSEKYCTKRGSPSLAASMDALDIRSQ